MSEASPEPKAFVLFSAGPAQRFIAAARTVRDLWTGSFLLSWLTRHAMEPIMQRCGPEAFVLPDMSRDPMPLNGAAGKPGAGSGFPLRVACLPNRFLAEVPETKAEELARQCQESFKEAWQEIVRAVREELEAQIGRSSLAAPWQEAVQRLWQAQVDSFFDDQDLRVVVLPWKDSSQQDLDKLLGPDTASSSASPAARLWRDRMQMTFRLLAAQKAIRKVTQYQPPADPLGMYGPKCTLLGTYEQIGPAEVSESARFWEEFAERIKVGGIRFRRGERLCAPSLVKRFAWPAYLAPRFGKWPRELWFEDTATAAAKEWLQEPPALDPQDIREQYGDWNGQWLHWNRPDQDPDDPCPKKIWYGDQEKGWEGLCSILKKKRDAQGRAPTYYAILMLDGDRMGERLNECVGSEAVRRV
ncbi:MAG TPA: type III-B CRISPR-associated protein Cas10/Cmr2, partial [Thermoguttaceae bacterium]|nr:type III-B CRISPR-associated protein Cas10/Cmr2 [Thermoguttaceae bacterium]